jgi:hypothetical protein
MWQSPAKDGFMTADQRNTAVVVALVLSLTAGIGVLTWLEPERPEWQQAPLLMAQDDLALTELTVHFAADRAALAALEIDENDGLCVVYADEPPKWWSGGPHVSVVVVGAGGWDTPMSRQQQEWLLGALGSLVQPVGLEHVRVRLARGSDVSLTSDLPQQAVDLRALLERKMLIQ